MFSLETLLQNKNVYRTQYPSGIVFYWKLLSYNEYRVLSNLRKTGDFTEIDLYTRVFDLCVLNKTSADKHVPLGYLVSTGKFIMYVSGDCETETLAQDLFQMKELHQHTSVREHMIRTVLTAFSGYTFEDADKWDRIELIEKFVLAEKTLVFRGHKITELDPSKITTLEELVNKQQTSQRPTANQSIDFAAEAQALAKQQNPLDLLEAENKEFETRRQKLNPEQAKKLSKR